MIPHVSDGEVICSCGSRMDAVVYASFPKGHRWTWYRCRANPDHVTAALPLKRRMFW